MAREDLHFRLRIPEDLKKRVEMAASHNHRSMTAEIIATLEEKYPPSRFARMVELVHQMVQEVANMEEGAEKENAKRIVEAIIDSSEFRLGQLKDSLSTTSSDTPTFKHRPKED